MDPSLATANIQLSWSHPEAADNMQYKIQFKEGKDNVLYFNSDIKIIKQSA